MSFRALALATLAGLGLAGQAHAAPSYQVLHTFTGPDGVSPVTPTLAIDPQGVVYGTTASGGAHGCGTVWSLAPPVFPKPVWGLHVLLGFPCASEAAQGVVRGPNGTIYVAWADQVYAIAPVTHATSQVASLSATPALAIDPLGKLYGVTDNGGLGGAGILFSATPPAPAVTLYSFGPGGYGGMYPTWLSAGQDGTVYGTTWEDGTIFQRVPGQAKITVLATVPPGSGRAVGVVPDNKGNLFGVTTGNAQGNGSFYKVSLGGGFQVLHDLSPGGVEGGGAFAPPIVGADGNLYGTLTGGGTANSGVLYRLTPAGQYTVLHDFTGAPDGGMPMTGLVQDKGGYLYRTAYVGGPNQYGVVFRFHA